jgi:cyclophilin family peptidyl-prolyl cis-trans isomerase
VLGILAVLAVVGAFALILVARGSGDERAATTGVGAGIGAELGEHWHAVLGINLCGTWAPPVPAFESDSGIHSHGDGYMHIHPFSDSAAGENATLGRFLDGAGVEVTERSIRVGASDYREGDDCPGLGPGRLRWSVEGREQTGDPRDHVMADGEVLALAFLPAGTEIGTPPAEGASGPTDVPGAAPAADPRVAGVVCDERQPAASTRRTYPSPPPMTIDPGRKYTATLDTTCGAIVVELEAATAPVAVNNFVFLARDDFYDGLTWHRLVRGFVIQGGDPEGQGTGGPGYDVAGEPPPDGYEIGSLGAAKTAVAPAGSMGSQFFIVTGRNGTALPPEYARFGKVAKGIEVALKLESFASSDESPLRPLYIFDIAIAEE